VSELEKNQLKCPKCDGVLFKAYLVTCRGISPIGGTLTFYLMECSECGWKSHPEDVEELRKFLYKIMVEGVRSRE
jgi:C4-type Zn-finger protein